ncbi:MULTISPECIES: MerR family transcriptional regulator [Mycolicibacterium]|uniref:MerR family transcriptional regulator n=1 Tax=Mycolicibacterium senegalense TaxID=1796 RepID=A0A378T275_9MYCO|nr:MULTISPECIES: MerR family transcriptional regulator [Mycolicibacterium]MCV7339042.1 MerR family transcriptional regulator [Mycolicibacterium senegalense]MDR7289443.1 DNA-binding transcriptional MerR regulator [Mycolicibacterium senegalense]QZA26283.1 MerR family transcriptional regulator [Mycolicibacterium senegalense]CDP88893.1 MerR family transcriptional regulator [Mycolicibacterium farcinogenes]STZ53616.1 MerR family transcriptional regulator [Mycolicibacterium senegalense]
MSEYRLEDLARISGVSARNIRAYRERGLLDSPRRVGRSAYYGERHLAQLTAISQLLAKGFNSAHIAEFFAGLRSGKDLSEALGIDASDWCRPDASTLNVDPDDDDVRALAAAGLVRVVEGSAEMPDPALAALVTGAQDQRRCIRIVAHVARSTDAAVDQVATAAAAALNETREEPSGTDLRQLVHAVVSVEVERAVRKSLATAD